MQKITIECAPTRFFCPVTGQPILSESGFRASPAVVFAFVSEADEFGYVDPEYATASQQASSRALDDTSIIERFLHLIADRRIVVFHLGGQFIGDPDCYIGIDFGRCPFE